MEKFRRKRSKVTSIADRNSYNSFLQMERISRQGSIQVQKQRNLPKLASDSSSCSSVTSNESSLTFEFGRRSSKQDFGTPMKKLLSKEMSKETKSKRRMPGVIAKLMGLEGLPPPQATNKQHKPQTEKHSQSQRGISMEKAQRAYTSFDGQISRRKSREQQEFKDVFEVLQTSKVGNSSFSNGTRISEAEMAFIQQKFMDAKRLSTDERLQESKEFLEALEVLDSNKDLLLKFLQQPESLFTKHVHDLQESLPHSNCGYIQRGTQQKNYNKSYQKHRDDFFSHYDCIHTPSKCSKCQVEEKDEVVALPKRIVVLKPNMGKAQTAANIILPHSFHLDYRKQAAERKNIMIREAEFSGKRMLPNDVGLSRHKSRESREIAKEITRQMRNSYSPASRSFLSSGYKGYTGDESSCNTSENESSNDSDVVAVSSRKSIEMNCPYRLPLSCSKKTSVTREAKKRLSERWRMTHNSVDMGEFSRGRTLAEMLTVPDKEIIMPVHLDARITEVGYRDKFSINDVPEGWIEPLGISSRDGWKDVCSRKLSRSRSLPSSLTSSVSPKTRQKPNTLSADKYLVPNEALKWEGQEAVKGSFAKKEGSIRRNARSSNKKSNSSHSMVKENNEPTLKFHPLQNRRKINFSEHDPSEDDILVFDTSPTNVKDKDPVLENAIYVRHENAIVSSDGELQPDSFSHLSEKANSCCSSQDNSLLEELSSNPSGESSVSQPVPKLESPASSKESDQPSPVSVLEPPFTDDLSSCSECFESLNADLHGLRMQLKLLKLESKAYNEVPIVISSDNDADEESREQQDHEGLCKAKENPVTSYLTSVLMESGLKNDNLDTFIQTWHSPDCPINPLVFDELVNKNSDQTSQSRSERRLLFDRINWGILEMFEDFTDAQPWVRMKATKVGGIKWIQNGLEGGLSKMLATSEKNVNREETENVLLRGTQWVNLRDGIDAIGQEIETWLTDELVLEVVVEMM